MYSFEFPNFLGQVKVCYGNHKKKKPKPFSIDINKTLQIHKIVRTISILKNTSFALSASVLVKLLNKLLPPFSSSNLNESENSKFASNQTQRRGHYGRGNLWILHVGHFVSAHLTTNTYRRYIWCLLIIYVLFAIEALYRTSFYSTITPYILVSSIVWNIASIYSCKFPGWNDVDRVA